MQPNVPFLLWSVHQIDHHLTVPGMWCLLHWFQLGNQGLLLNVVPEQNGGLLRPLPGFHTWKDQTHLQIYCTLECKQSYLNFSKLLHENKEQFWDSNHACGPYESGTLTSLCGNRSDSPNSTQSDLNMDSWQMINSVNSLQKQFPFF